jgi:hypothetical protein
MAEAARLGISSKIKVLEEGETMRLVEQASKQRTPVLKPHRQNI